MRLDEWQRYIDSEFLEARDSASVESRAKAPDVPVGSPDSAVGVDVSAPAVSDPLASEAAPTPDGGTGLDADAVLSYDAPTQSDPFPKASRLDMRREIDPEIGARAAAIDLGAPELTIAPFVDYITARRVAVENVTNADADVDSAPTADSAPDRSAQAIRDVPLSFQDAQSAAESASDLSAGFPVGNVATGARPLVPAGSLQAQLQRIEYHASNETDLDLRLRREALVQRMCDPILSLEEAAILLGISPARVRRDVKSGALKPAAASQNRGSSDRKFRLSDILASAANDGPSLEV